VQGLAAAMISPSALSILGVIYTGQDRVRAISVYGMTLGLAAAGAAIGAGAGSAVRWWCHGPSCR
jgi:hypothetical protein